MSFATADLPVQSAIGVAYHQIYDGYGQRIVGSVVGEKVHPLTLRLTPTRLTDAEHRP